MLVCLAAAVIAPPPGPPSTWGLATLQMIRREFRYDGVPGFAEAIGDGKLRQPVFNWGAGVLMSAMNAAARVDPKRKGELRRFVDATRAYWNTAGPVAGFDVAPMPKPVDRYYDDNAWMVMALVDASTVLKDPKVLDTAKKALGFVLSGEDDKLGGGVYWRENAKGSKNTCSNGPAAAACLAVYDRTKDPKLLEKARELYEWTKEHLQDPTDHLYWDSIRLDGTVERTKWSYNTALMIRSAAELSRITGDVKFRRDAEEMATASEKRWFVNGRLADAGRFAHLLLESWNYVPSPDRKTKAREAVRWLWEHGRSKRGMFGGRFDQAPAVEQKRFELIDQASAARAFLMAP